MLEKQNTDRTYQLHATESFLYGSLMLGPNTKYQITEADPMKEWLVSPSDSALGQRNFCQRCYKAGGSMFFGSSNTRAGKSSTHERYTSYAAQYVSIRHFIGSLGSHMKAASLLVETEKHCPMLFTD